MYFFIIVTHITHNSSSSLVWSRGTLRGTLVYDYTNLKVRSLYIDRIIHLYVFNMIDLSFIPY